MSDKHVSYERAVKDSSVGVKCMQGNSSNRPFVLVLVQTSVTKTETAAVAHQIKSYTKKWTQSSFRQKNSSSSNKTETKKKGGEGGLGLVGLGRWTLAITLRYQRLLLCDGVRLGPRVVLQEMKADLVPTLPTLSCLAPDYDSLSSQQEAKWTTWNFLQQPH